MEAFGLFPHALDLWLGAHIYKCIKLDNELKNLTVGFTITICLSHGCQRDYSAMAACQTDTNKRPPVCLMYVRRKRKRFKII